MSDAEPSDAPNVLRPDVVTGPGDEPTQPDPATTDRVPTDRATTNAETESVDQPAKVMRLGTMLKHLLDEVRETTLDEGARERLLMIYETSITEVGSALSADLRAELDRLASPFAEDDLPSAAELRIAKAQLVGWLEGLVQGIQATLFAQQVMAQQQLAHMQGQQSLGRGQGAEPTPGTYL